MTQQEHRSFEICIKEIKQIAIRNQLYEFAAISRDLERELSSMITNDQLASEWHKIAVIDSFQYYEKIERIINQYSTSKIDESLHSRNSLRSSEFFGARFHLAARGPNSGDAGFGLQTNGAFSGSIIATAVSRRTRSLELS